MLKNHFPIRIEWGDCDAAAITFYPNYFRWFDAATWRLFEKAGVPAARLREEQGVLLPLVDARAQFKRPGHLGDDLVLESFVAEWRDRFFLVQHVARRGEDVVLEGSELRAWVVRHPEDPRRFKALTVPDEVRACFDGA